MPAAPEEIVFGHSTTVLVRFLATAMASQLQPGDEIVVTDFDHESNIGPWLTLKERGVVFKVWEIDRDTLQARPRCARQADGTAHAPGLRHARLQHSGNHQPDPRDRRFRACARRENLRRRRRLCTAPGDRRAGARRRFLRVLALQDLRPASRRDVWPLRASARARRALPLFLRQGESVGQARAGQSELRAGLGQCGDRRLSGNARRGRRPAGDRARLRGDRRSRGEARRTAAVLAARPQRCPHHRRARLGAGAARADHFLHRRGQGFERYRRPDRHGEDRRPPRRLPLAATDRGAGPRVERRRSVSRWCTTTRRPRWPVSSRRWTARCASMSCVRPTGRTPRQW